MSLCVWNAIVGGEMKGGQCGFDFGKITSVKTAVQTLACTGQRGYSCIT